MIDLFYFDDGGKLGQYPKKDIEKLIISENKDENHLEDKGLIGIEILGKAGHVWGKIKKDNRQELDKLIEEYNLIYVNQYEADFSVSHKYISANIINYVEKDNGIYLLKIKNYDAIVINDSSILENISKYVKIPE